MIEGYLVANGCKVTLAPTIERLERIAGNPTANLLILDFGIVGADPLALARRISERTRLGILMLTSSSDSVERIVSLEAGADDCLSKPFDMRELLARAKAILRRLSKAAQPQVISTEAGDKVLLGECILDLSARTLRNPQGRDVPITEMEFSLLKTFVSHPNQALNRDELAELAYGRSWNPFDRSLDIRISRLRRKIERDPARPEVILTVRGVGYRYEARYANQ
jgi:two-component system phosphate regulon response regulator OmpR